MVTVRAPAVRAFSIRLTSTSLNSSFRTLASTEASASTRTLRAAAQRIQGDGFFSQHREVQHVERARVDGGGAKAAEGTRDSVQSFDLGEDLAGGPVECRPKIAPPIPMGTQKVLHAQPNRCQRVLDLVGDLLRHFTPRQDPNSSGQIR